VLVGLAKDGVYCIEQIVNAERLCEKELGPVLASFPLTCACRHEQHACRRVYQPGLHRAEHLVAVGLGHLDVQDHQIERLLAEQVEGFAVRCSRSWSAH